MNMTVKTVMRKRSLPSWECGLKSLEQERKNNCSVSHSLRGSVDWNTDVTEYAQEGSVTPFVGVLAQKHWQGKYRACMQLEWAGTKELLSDGADFIKQLYEYYYLRKNEIKELQKNISSELLTSFGQQLTKTEDIKVELHRAVLNGFNFRKEGDACQEENTNLCTFLEGIRIIIQCG